MAVPKSILKIIEADHCPLYQPGDMFSLNGSALAFPPGKTTCITLGWGMREAVRFCQKVEGNPEYHFTCSGPEKNCEGLVRMEWKNAPAIPESGGFQEKYEKVRAIIRALSQYPLFTGLNEKQLTELGTFLKFRRFSKGETVMRKGGAGHNLYIITSGRVEVSGESDIHIAYLGKGEVFGEMSLISGEPVAASVRTVEATKLLYIKGKDFLRIVEHYPSVQMYLSRMLAKRLSESNIAMSEELTSGMVGRFTEISPSELFQTLNANQKSGSVEMIFPEGNGRVSFRDGELIRSVFKEKEGPDAFYAILNQHSGQFRFNSDLPAEEKELPFMGDFMWLLMEGIRRQDEENTE